MEDPIGSGVVRTSTEYFPSLYCSMLGRMDPRNSTRMPLFASRLSSVIGMHQVEPFSSLLKISFTRELKTALGSSDLRTFIPHVRRPPTELLPLMDPRSRPSTSKCTCPLASVFASTVAVG